MDQRVFSHCEAFDATNMFSGSMRISFFSRSGSGSRRTQTPHLLGSSFDQARLRSGKALDSFRRFAKGLRSWSGNRRD